MDGQVCQRQVAVATAACDLTTEWAAIVDSPTRRAVRFRLRLQSLEAANEKGAQYFVAEIGPIEPKRGPTTRSIVVA